MGEGGGVETPENPRSVSRGLDLQVGYLGLDSLYVVLEYPYPDVYRRWVRLVKDLTDPRLNDGLVTPEGYLVRKGGLGYRLSVWDGDARLYLTDRVDEELSNTAQTGQGMGMMLQLGPKWLCAFGDYVTPQTLLQNVLAQLLLFEVRGPEDYPLRLNRMDIALDVLGLRVADFAVEDWRRQWVGRASQKHFYDAPRTGQLEGLAIGSSEGAIRFKVYDKMAESEKRGTGRFWRSVWDLGEGEVLPVARFEWSIRCYAARFAGVRYLSDLTFARFLDILNYVTLHWGRLCLPQENDTNPSRWPLAPLWVELRRLIEQECWSGQHPARREYDYSVELTPNYLRSMVGWWAGFLARIGLNDYSTEPATVEQGLDYLRREGFGQTEVERRALKRWKVLSNLMGKAP